MENKKIYFMIVIVLVILAMVFIVTTQRDRGNIDTTQRTYCTEEQRNVEACIELWAPVCGYKSDSSETYSNDCFACANSEVIYWISGECD
jgi:hypothetical protein